MTDYFSKWPEAQAIPNKSAKCVSEFLFRMILRYGCMDIVISDQGREFVNQVFKRVPNMIVNVFVQMLILSEPDSDLFYHR